VLWCGKARIGIVGKGGLAPILKSHPCFCLSAARAKFSLEASSGAMDEALVDVRGCDFRGEDLSTKVGTAAEVLCVGQLRARVV
jgi:hypothetical protein